MKTRAALLLFLLCPAAFARPVVSNTDTACTVTATGYRVVFPRDGAGLSFELPAADGKWQPVARTPRETVSALMADGAVLEAGRQRATWALREEPEYIAVSRCAVLGLGGRTAVQLEYVCCDEGLLLGYRLSGEAREGIFWLPPRLALRPEDWGGYAFYGADGRRHAGALADLQPLPAYAGVSPWGAQGDTVARLEAQRPALIIRSGDGARGLGVVYLDYDRAWQKASAFIQRHTADALYLYGGFSPAAYDTLHWAWLAPFPSADPAAESTAVQALLKRGEGLVAAYNPPAATIPEDWLKPLPDFPAALRRPAPVSDIRDAVVYTVNEDTNSPEGLETARKVGSDVLVRAWFKWAQAPEVKRWQEYPQRVHELGALFGGGITCSALYDTENGLTPAQVADMATRGPDGNYVDAWDTKGIRHGSLSSPAYLDYLFRWCREQIDAGADYLFMDENTAALSEREGYDDHSLRDFRQYLLQDCPQTRGLKPDDPRWRETWGVPLASRAVCPDGTAASFDYRAYLRENGLLEKPNVEANRLTPLWWQFRSFRDDRAWKALTDRIRAYARERGRPVLISGNGLVKYVDLQLLGVWGQWLVKDGHVDLSESLLSHWRTQVERGRELAGGPVPVVFFHDWGFGEPPFPWMAVSPADRELWMRTRGAEIYAAGGFFAFPVLGPFGCNAAEDATLSCIARQTAFYQAHRDLYLRSRYLGTERLTSATDRLTLAASWNPDRKAVLVHVINRAAEGTTLAPRRQVTVRLPLATLPRQCTLITPDAPGETEAAVRAQGEAIEVTVPSLQAYTVAVLTYAADPDLSRLADPVYARTNSRWARPERTEFRVLPDGAVDNPSDLLSFLQGRLHTELRNPPTFIVKAQEPGRLEVHVRAVATAGARLDFAIDGKAVQSVDLPDLDGKNDGNTPEYNRTITFEIPAGEHRVTVDNTGGDWAAIDWYAFRGKWE